MESADLWKSKKLEWEDHEGFLCGCCAEQLPSTANLQHHSPFTTDIKTPYSNLTAEVEWWHDSSRVPCCMYRILMAARQRPQAPGQFYIPKPIVCGVAPCWHAITQTVFTFGFCLVFFSSCLFCASPPNLSSTPAAGSSSPPLFNPRVPAFQSV